MGVCGLATNANGANGCRSCRASRSLSASGPRPPPHPPPFRERECAAAALTLDDRAWSKWLRLLWGTAFVCSALARHSSSPCKGEDRWGQRRFRLRKLRANSREPSYYAACPMFGRTPSRRRMAGAQKRVSAPLAMHSPRMRGRTGELARPLIHCRDCQPASGG